FQRRLDAAGDRWQRGQVKHDLAAPYRPFDGGRVGDAARHQFDPVADVGQVAFLAGAQIVEHTDLPVPVQQAFDQMRTDKACPAGYQTWSHDKPPAFVPKPRVYYILMGFAATKILPLPVWFARPPC